jgi:hypothetical protein
MLRVNRETESSPSHTSKAQERQTWRVARTRRVHDDPVVKLKAERRTIHCVIALPRFITVQPDISTMDCGEYVIDPDVPDLSKVTGLDSGHLQQVFFSNREVV